MLEWSDLNRSGPGRPLVVEVVARWGEGVDLDPLEADAAVGKDERLFFGLPRSVMAVWKYMCDVCN